jgi:nitroreductase
MPTQIVCVQDPSIKTRLANNAMLGVGNQYRVRDASMTAVFLADLELNKRIDRVEKLERDSKIRDPNYLATMPIVASFLAGEGHAATLLKQVATSVMSHTVKPMPSIEPVQAWSYKNAALLAQTYVLAATSHGLATSIMEGFDSRRVKEILRVPDRYDIPLMVATGYEYEDASTFRTTPRLDIEEVVFQDTFGEPIDLSDFGGPESDEDERVAGTG